MTDHTDDEIRIQARRLWEEAGRPEGRDQEFWFRAAHSGGAPDTGNVPSSTPRPQNGESRPIAPGPSGMEQTDDQDNLNNNVSTVG